MTQPLVVLVILDGWGVAPPSRGNPLRLAATPRIDALCTTYPTMLVQASGEAVGLPWGEMGNSEVGHLTLGAGKAMLQDLQRINRALRDGTFATNAAFRAAFEHVKARGSALHVAGLVSAGGVHSFDEHLYAILRLAHEQGIAQVFVHAFLDGRDVVFNSGKESLQQLQAVCDETGAVIATVSGRLYAMDRDHRWERTEAAYRAMVDGAGVVADNPADAITASYGHDVYDEEFVPTVMTHAEKPVATIRDHDAIIFTNFRNDRMRQLTSAFVQEPFTGFARTKLDDLFVVTMTEYQPDFAVHVAFPPQVIEAPLAKVVSDAGMKQLHIAETEKYAHVTFFFNGGREEPFADEERILIPSPHVASYADKPEMSALEITDAALKALAKQSYQLLVINYANADMVAHTGNGAAVQKAAMVLDACVGRLVDATLAAHGTLVLTADHGNAEDVLNVQTGAIDKEHSATPVPLIIVNEELHGVQPSPSADLSSAPSVGMLSDVAPTICSLLHIPVPPSMTGRSLLPSV